MPVMDAVETPSRSASACVDAVPPATSAIWWIAFR